MRNLKMIGRPATGLTRTDCAPGQRARDFSQQRRERCKRVCAPKRLVIILTIPFVLNEVYLWH